MNRRYISVNLDVDELEAKSEEVVEKDLLKVQIKGDFFPELYE